MFYCPTCKNTYDISKDIIKLQHGGATIDYDHIVINITNTQLIESVANDPSFLLDNVYKSAEFKKLNKSQKEYVINKINDQIHDVDNNNKQKIDASIKEGLTAYFHCKNCSNTEEIKPGTKIYGISADNQASNYGAGNYYELIYSDILPITRQYKCENSKCISHKDISKREAKFFRINNTYKIKFICLACEAIF